jgi:hypothetical protein
LSQINSNLVTSNLLAVNKISDKVLLSAISDLSKLNEHKLLKLPAGGFEKGRPDTGGHVNSAPHPDGLPRLPVTVGDGGVRVGLFSTGDQGSGGSLIGLLSPEKHDAAGTGTGKLQDAVSGVTGTVTSGVGGTVSTVTSVTQSTVAGVNETLSGTTSALTHSPVTEPVLSTVQNTVSGLGKVLSRK